VHKTMHRLLGTTATHLGKYHLFSISTSTHSPATYAPKPPHAHNHYDNHTQHAPPPPLHFHPLQGA
jgi:hypothetical protein